ncbi:MAG TPA: hypothetical protein VFY38_01190 [Pseudonocardia sp.]|nr:hypothetical protein [Pseudonocardia sp.]
MAKPVTVNDVLDGQVALDLECLDRIYLNGWVNNLQVGGQALLLFLWVRFGGAAQGAGPLLPGQGRLRRRYARALRAPLDLRASAAPSGRACGQAGGLPGWCAAPPNLRRVGGRR